MSSRGVIDLSCDLGEAQTEEERAVESMIWPLISSANIACGGHVGDERSIREAVDRCVEYAVTLGAHPSYPDSEGFGRRHIEIESAELESSLVSQLSAFGALSAEHGIPARRVKPHGALYNEAQRSAPLARILVSAVKRSVPSAALVCAAGSEVERAAKEAGLTVVYEAFVDRRYKANGMLQPRNEKGSLLLELEEAAAQALRLAESGTVIAADGTVVPVRFQTLCAHSDMPGSVARIRRVRTTLADAGFSVGSSEE